MIYDADMRPLCLSGAELLAAETLRQALPAFSGEQTTCPKCTHRWAGIEWQPNGTFISDRSLIDAAQIGDSGLPGKLLRTCRCCGWRWFEATADAT